MGPTQGGTRVTILGSGFTSHTTVYFGKRKGLKVKVLSSKKLLVVTPSAEAGTVKVSVRTSSVSNALKFTYVPPSIKGVSPASGRTSGGKVTVITGKGFAPGASVYFGKNKASVVRRSPTSLTVKTPAHAVGTVDVKVTQVGADVTKKHAYRYYRPVVHKTIRYVPRSTKGCCCSR